MVMFAQCECVNALGCTYKKKNGYNDTFYVYFIFLFLFLMCILLIPNFFFNCVIWKRVGWCPQLNRKYAGFPMAFPFHCEFPENRERYPPSQSGGSPRTRKRFPQTSSCSLRAWTCYLHHQADSFWGWKCLEGVRLCLLHRTRSYPSECVWGGGKWVSCLKLSSLRPSPEAQKPCKLR